MSLLKVIGSCYLIWLFHNARGSNYTDDHCISWPWNDNDIQRLKRQFWDLPEPPLFPDPSLKVKIKPKKFRNGIMVHDLPAFICMEPIFHFGLMSISYGAAWLYIIWKSISYIHNIHLLGRFIWYGGIRGREGGGRSIKTLNFPGGGLSCANRDPGKSGVSQLYIVYLLLLVDNG